MFASLDISRIKHLSITVLLGGTVMFLFSCSPNKKEEVSEYIVDETQPTMSADTFTMIYSDSALVRFRMKAPEVLNFEDYLEFPKGIYVEKIDEDEQVSSQLTADYARHIEKKSLWIAKNNVVAINAEGDSLKTEELFWDEKKGRIYSEKQVQIVRADQIINGIGFESDQTMENWEILKPTGIIYLEMDKQ